MSQIPASTSSSPRFPWVTLLGILAFGGWWAGSREVRDVHASPSVALQPAVNVERLRTAFLPGTEEAHVVEPAEPALQPAVRAGGAAAAGQ